MKTYINLLKELPDNTIIFKLSSNKKYTNLEMINELENNTELGRIYISDLLRISRDILKRQSNKNKNKNEKTKIKTKIKNIS